VNIILLRSEVDIMVNHKEASSLWYHELNYMLNVYIGNRRINFIDMINDNTYYTAKIDYNQFISDVIAVYNEAESMVERKTRYYHLSPTIKLNIAESAKERLLSRVNVNNSLKSALKSLTRIAKKLLKR